MNKFILTFICGLCVQLVFGQQYDCFSKERLQRINNMTVYYKQIDAYNDALKECPQHKQILYSRGITHYFNKYYELAIADFERLLLLDPLDCKAYKMLALSYGDAANYEKQLDVYSRQVEKNCNVNGTLYKNRAWTYAELARYSEAIKEYDEAEKWFLANKPSEIWSLYYNKANTYFRMGQYQDAIATYNRCEAEVRTNTPEMLENFYRYRAGAYYANKQNEKAFDDIEKAILLNPNYGAPFALRAHIYRSLGKTAEATKDWNHAVDLHKENSELDAFDAIYMQYAAQKPINEKVELGEEAVKKAIKMVH